MCYPGQRKATLQQESDRDETKTSARGNGAEKRQSLSCPRRNARPRNSPFYFAPPLVYQPDVSLVAVSAHSVVAAGAAAPDSQLAGWVSAQSPPVAAGKAAGAASQSPAPVAKPVSTATTSSSAPTTFSSSTFSSASASGSRSANSQFRASGSVSSRGGATYRSRDRA